MSRIIPQILALVLVSTFVLCQPTIVAASTLTKTSQKSQSQVPTAKVVDSYNLARLEPVAVEPGKKSNEEKPAVVSSEKMTKKKVLRSKSKNSSKRTYLKSDKKAGKLTANSHRHLGDKEDCNACHTNCLIAGLACIAISIATACPLCGVICLGAQAGCEGVCNTTTACQNLNN